MSETDLLQLLERKNVSPPRIAAAKWVESKLIQTIVIGVILLNAVILGFETSKAAMASFGGLLVIIDKICLAVFVVELLLKMFAYRTHFWRSGWNVFDFLVVAVALVPGAGVWAVLRSLRVLRILRLLTAIPSLKKVVAAFIHSIPGLSSVMALMSIFFYTMGVLATRLFGETHPAWFGSLGDSLYTLFQIMTLESWSMGICTPSNGGSSLGLRFLRAVYHSRDVYDPEPFYRYHRIHHARALPHTGNHRKLRSGTPLSFGKNRYRPEITESPDREKEQSLADSHHFRLTRNWRRIDPVRTSLGARIGIPCENFWHRI